MITYNLNDVVNHKIFGKGKVVGIEQRKTIYNTPDLPIITVEFEEPMLTVEEKGMHFIKAPIAIRQFTSVSLHENCTNN